MAIKQKPRGILIPNVKLNFLITSEYLLLVPKDCVDEDKPWTKCNAKKIKAKQYKTTL